VGETTSYSPGGRFLEELEHLLESDADEGPSADLFAKLLMSSYFKDLLTTFAAMGSLHEEIQQILADFNGRSAVFVKYLPIEHLVLLVKFYVVQWSTLMDMTAHMVNNGFNLGMDGQDVKFAVLARNKHVSQSELGGLFRASTKDLSTDEYRKHRNEIVHRGRILETDVLQLKREWDTLAASKYSLLLGNPINELEYQKKSEELTRKNFELGLRLQAKYGEHYAKTIRFMDHVAKIIAAKAKALVIKGAI
jgi:hypothetical protein